LQDIKFRTLIIFALILFLSFIVSKIFTASTAIIFLIFALTIYLISHIFWINELSKWLDKPKSTEIPDGKGIWQDIFSKIYKNYFNTKCKQINENALNNYLSFLSKTEHNYNSYWNKIFESDVDVDLKLDNCLKDVLKFKTFDPDFYKNLWKKELEHLDNFSKKDIEDSESTYKYPERINNDK